MPVPELELLGFDLLANDEVEQLNAACDLKLIEYVKKREIAIRGHRRSLRSAGLTPTYWMIAF
jgi:hypothetical protein